MSPRNNVNYGAHLVISDSVFVASIRVDLQQKIRSKTLRKDLHNM